MQFFNCSFLAELARKKNGYLILATGGHSGNYSGKPKYSGRLPGKYL
jgi:hypothetical protein